MQPRLAADEVTARKVREIQSQTDRFLSDLDRYLELAKRNPHGGMPLSDDVEEAGRLRNLLMFGLTNAQGQGVIREGERPLYEKMIPDITSFRLGFSPEYATRIQSLKKIMQNNTAQAIRPFLQD